MSVGKAEGYNDKKRRGGGLRENAGDCETLRHDLP